MRQSQVRFSGARPRSEVFHVDYAVVLQQAVENERYRLLREIRKGLAAVATEGERRHDSYQRDPRSAADFKDDVLALIDRLESSDSGSDT